MRALVLLLAAWPAAAAVPRVSPPRAAAARLAPPAPPSAGLATLPALAQAPKAAVAPAPAAAAPALEALSASLTDGEGQAAALAAAFDGSLPPDDDRGALMQAAIDASRSMKLGETAPLRFKPSRASLRRLGKFDGYELLLSRARDGRWTMTRGDARSVPNAPADADLYIHNHFYHPVYAKSFTPYPSDPDLVFSAGKDARFFVVSDDGLVEWSPRVPYYPYSRSKLSPERQARLLDPAKDKDHDWNRRFRAGNPARMALNLVLPAFYGSLLKASGIDFTLYRWSDPRLTQDFIDRK